MALAPALIVLLLQAPPPSSKTVDAETEFFQGLETRIANAIQLKSVAALEPLLAMDFTFNLFLEGRAPEVMNRDEWLKSSEHYMLKNFELRHLAVRVFDKIAAVRLQPNHNATVGNTLDRSGEFSVVDIWSRDGDTWKLSARYLSRPDSIKR